MYVWVDAPIGYIGFTEEWAEKARAAGNESEDWKNYWCDDKARITHFIGQDITYHHCVFWPAMLKGAGYGTPYAVVASGMVKIDDHKFSKSRGYVVWTNDDYLDKGLPSDYLRYYILTYTSHTKEMNFSWKLFLERVNTEVVNTLGNFIYRSLNLSHKQFNGIPDATVESDVKDRISEAIQTVCRNVESYDFKAAVDAIMTLAAYGNNYIQTREPWKLAKTDPALMAQVMRNCLQVAKALALLIAPVMPDRAAQLWTQLGLSVDIDSVGFEEGLVDLTPGPLPAPTIIFEKLDEKQIQGFDDALRERVDALTRTEAPDTSISIEEFGKVELMVGKVLQAEPVPKSSKLLKLQVNFGSETRQIVSGIAQFYSPDDLVGKNVVAVMNLKPAKIFGIESNGMILAAGDEASLLVPLRDVEAGTKIR